MVISSDHGNNDVVHAMGVMPGGAVWREPPLGHPNLLIVDLNLGLGGKHPELSQGISGKPVQGTKTTNT